MSGVRRFALEVTLALAAVGAVGAGSALAAAPTIDNYNLLGSGGTFAECGNVDVEHNDNFPAVTGSGPFSVSHTFAPADSTASCGAGSGTDQTSGSLSGTGTVDSNDVLRLSDNSQGSTTTTTSYVGDQNNDCLDVGLDIGTGNTVQFTITQDTPFSYAGTLSSSGQQANGSGRVSYSLTRTSQPSATIFDQTQGLSPNIKGTLSAGTYQYHVNGSASNDLACNKTGTETDTFSYSVHLTVGTVPPPSNTALPAISGTPAVGQILTCSNGSWDNNPTSFAYQWGSDGVAIAGATSQTYTVQPGDQGHTVTCTVTATNDGGDTPATSAGVAIPPPPAGVPVNSAPPAISGTPGVGQTLRCSNGSWSNNPTAFGFRWNRDGAAIPGATNQTYAVQPGDQGHALTCSVTASNGSGSGPPSSSAPVSVTKAAAAAPNCTVSAGKKVTVLRSHGKVTGGTLRITARCDQSAKVKLTTVLTDKLPKRHHHQPAAKHFRLPPINATVGAGRIAVLKLSLPAAAVKDLLHRAKESLAVGLTASNANGTSHTTTGVRPLTV